MWRGWTTKENAHAYDSYLRNELFPRLKRELGQFGYRGFHLLRRHHENEEEFVTMVWFDSLDAVQSFAGADYETPVIAEKGAVVAVAICRPRESLRTQWIQVA